MKPDSPRALLVSPWVTDFKCYDEWMEPLGLLWIARFLESNGFEIDFVNCLDRFAENDTIKPGKAKKFGTGDFSHVEIKKPELYESIPRKYKQYGISEQRFAELLRARKKPDVILVSSGMTYWFDGLKRTIELTQRIFNDSKVLVGGSTASLCPEKVRAIPGVDEVLVGRFCTNHLRRIVESCCSPTLSLSSSHALTVPLPSEWPHPDYSYLGPRLGHRAVVTSFGCPFRCTYCASHVLEPTFQRRSPEMIVEEIQIGHDQGIRDFVFYDDALLYKYEEQLAIVLRKLKSLGLKMRFHTPNGMHARWVTAPVAKELFESGFQILRIGYETDAANVQKSTGGKVSNHEMAQSLASLREAGFRKDQIGVYLMVGLNGEPWENTLPRARWVQEQGARALPNLLSPVPHTQDYGRLVKEYPVLAEDPRSHNDIFFAFHSGIVDKEGFDTLKRTVREGNA